MSESLLLGNQSFANGASIYEELSCGSEGGTYPRDLRETGGQIQSAEFKNFRRVELGSIVKLPTSGPDKNGP
jgi:hypothetical protein